VFLVRRAIGLPHGCRLGGGVPTTLGGDVSGGATAPSSISIGEAASEAAGTPEDDMAGEEAASEAGATGTAANGTGAVDAAGEGTADGTTASDGTPPDG